MIEQEKTHNVPQVLYRTTRDNADYMTIHADQWYHSDEAFHIVDEENRLYYKNECGETILTCTVTHDWSKQQIYAYIEFLFQNGNEFRE